MRACTNVNGTAPPGLEVGTGNGGSASLGSGMVRCLDERKDGSEIVPCFDERDGESSVGMEK